MPYIFTYKRDTVLIPEELTVSIIADTYDESIDKIRELALPDVKRKELILTSVEEFYDDAMYIGELDMDAE